jgi:hypothetical protein
MTGVRLFAFRTMIALATPWVIIWVVIERLSSEFKLAFRVAWLDVRSVYGDAVKAWDDAATMSWDEMKTKVEKSRE